VELSPRKISHDLIEWRSRLEGPDGLLLLLVLMFIGSNAINWPSEESHYQIKINLSHELVSKKPTSPQTIHNTLSRTLRTPSQTEAPHSLLHGFMRSLRNLGIVTVSVNIYNLVGGLSDHRISHQVKKDWTLLFKETQDEI